MDKVRVAIVGCGTISRLNVPGYIEDERCEVAVLCDPVRERAEVRAKEWGIAPRFYTAFEDVLNDDRIDAVELLTPTYMHPQQIIDCLGAGKHVSCQKPISSTVEEADRVIEASGKSDRICRITENFLYYPPIVKAKELIDSGAIGDPSLVHIRANIGKEALPRRTDILQREMDENPEAFGWRKDPQLNAGGIMYDGGWHLYATAMWWVGDEVERLSSLVTKTDDLTDETPSAAIMKLKDRDCLLTFSYSTSSNMPIRAKYYPGDEFFEVIGDRGILWVTRCTGEFLDMPPVVLHTGRGSEGFQLPMDWIDGFKGAAQGFVSSIIDGTQPQMDVGFSKKVLQVALGIYIASDTGRTIDPGALG